MVRCAWAESHPLLETYHDSEWGTPVHDDRRWFEYIVLDGAQAGLSWLTVLKKREGYRRAFADFDYARVADYTSDDVARILLDDGIIRNRLKVESTVRNARAFLRVRETHGSFDSYIWDFTDGSTIRNAWTTMSDLPATSPISDRMSRELKRLGFNFVGSTICYSFMQAAGMVNDHVVTCFRYSQI